MLKNCAFLKILSMGCINKIHVLIWLQIIQERNWCIVTGLNWKIVRQGKTKTFPGMVSREEMPLLVTTEVKLVDPSDE